MPLDSSATRTVCVVLKVLRTEGGLGEGGEAPDRCVPASPAQVPAVSVARRFWVRVRTPAMEGLASLFHMY